jgi:hypothetical protein
VRIFALLMSSALVASSPLLADAPAPETFVYSNEEQVYFAREANQDAPPIVHFRVEKYGDGKAEAKVTAIDAFGAPSAADSGLIHGIAQVMEGDARFDPANFSSQSEGGPRYQFRRARPATCWVAIKKDKPKADGSPDWFFAQGVKLHDQGGRAIVGKDAADTQPVMIRMRNVVWPPKADGTPSSNKPSIVLYVHKPDQYDRSEAYVWGDPGAARIGINLRWMQASCGIDGMEQPSAVTATSFRR